MSTRTILKSQDTQPKFPRNIFLGKKKEKKKYERLLYPPLWTHYHKTEIS